MTWSPPSPPTSERDSSLAMGEMAPTWRELHRQTRLVIGDPVARWLCEEASGATSESGGLDDVLGDQASPRMVAHLETMTARHLAGEPLAYVLGHWSFRRLDLAVDRRVLIPRPETEVVAGVALELARQLPRPLTVADLGTGSGAIGLALADELPLDGVTVWLTDLTEDVIHLARANLAGLGRPGRNVRIAIGAWFDALPPGTVLDLAVANPPYIANDSPDVEASVRAWEPSAALFAGPDGLDAIRAIVGDAQRWIRTGGWLVLEIGAGQGPAVTELLVGSGYEAVEIRPDLAGRDRIAVARVP
jgi:release factor glutamine methyltransferase